MRTIISDSKRKELIGNGESKLVAGMEDTTELE